MPLSAFSSYPTPRTQELLNTFPEPVAVPLVPQLIWCLVVYLCALLD